MWAYTYNLVYTGHWCQISSSITLLMYLGKVSHLNLELTKFTRWASQLALWNPLIIFLKHWDLNRLPSPPSWASELWIYYWVISLAQFRKTIWLDLWFQECQWGYLQSALTRKEDPTCLPHRLETLNRTKGKQERGRPFRELSLPIFHLTWGKGFPLLPAPWCFTDIYGAKKMWTEAPWSVSRTECFFL